MVCSVLHTLVLSLPAYDQNFDHSTYVCATMYMGYKHRPTARHCRMRLLRGPGTFGSSPIAFTPVRLTVIIGAKSHYCSTGLYPYKYLHMGGLLSWTEYSDC